MCVVADHAVMDGLTAVKEIRAAETAGTLMRNMVIALTGNARQGQIDQALQAGMDDGESDSSHLTLLFGGAMRR